MKISKVARAIPKSPPPSSNAAGNERFVWETLVPRLIGPLKLGIIEALLWVGRPLSPVDLEELLVPGESKLALVSYHAEYLTKAGVLEMVEIEMVEDEEGTSGGEARFYFPRRPPR
jgi:hypothetical protein